jgi:hypothetical protein
VNSGHFAVRKCGGVETRGLVRTLVEPDADRVLWLRVRMLLVSSSVFAMSLVHSKPIVPY